MTDNQLQPQTNQANQTNQQSSAADQPTLAPFGGALPFSNVPQQTTTPVQSQVVYAGGSEAAPVRITQESVQAPEQQSEQQKNAENKPETPAVSIEKREQKSLYPQNQAQSQVPQVVKPQPVMSVQPVKPAQAAPKFYGYMVAPQIANNFPLITRSKGKGKTDESRTWIYMLLDRILKKQANIKK